MPAIPRTIRRDLQCEHGRAIGISNRWEKGQYCSILTAAGIVGCGIYDLVTPAEFDQAIAIAKGTPANPLVEPEDLLEARIVGLTPKAASYGIAIGMSGREAANAPMIFRLATTSIIPAISGTATTPLTTALQNSIRMGLSGVKAAIRPAIVAAATIK